jgi:DNA-3-methyladenine glycosylase II
MSYLNHLSADKKLKPIIAQIGPLEIAERKNVFLNLVRSVAGQQLSTKAAASIFNKFESLFSTKNIKPKDVIAVDLETLRTVGFSYGKAQYILNIAQFWIDNKVTDATFSKKTDEEIIAFLLPIKGVGKWTVQMLLMFTLGRENVFAPDDLGIQQGMQALYNWPTMPIKDLKIKMMGKAKSYEPYCTYACLYLWRFKDAYKA